MQSALDSTEWLSLLEARSHPSLSDVNTELLRSGSPKISKTHLQEKSHLLPSSQLQVETDLSASIAVSIPYYNLSNYKGTFDTVDLLQSKEYTDLENRVSSFVSASASPQYANTSHISRDLYNNPAFEAATLDQVPPRFSQFIVAQSKLDSSAPTGSSEARHSRDISELMGSQATIFLTRPDGHETSKLKAKSRSRRSKAYPASSSVHLLTRQSAIRAKEGSFAYRFRLRMRKIAARLKSKMEPVWRFVLRSRKATSNVRMPLQRKSRFRSLRRVHWRSSVLPPVISGPMPISTFEHNSDDIEAYHAQKYAENSIFNERAGKMNHLSQFISEQRLLSNGPSQAAFLVDSGAPPPPAHTTTHGLEHYLVDREREEREKVQKLWHSYLVSVVALRIRLRQEISLFQLLLANQTVPSVFRRLIGDVALSHKASIVQMSLSKRDFSASESLISIGACSDLDGELSSPEVASDAETDDQNEEKLQHVLNRRSMLGEMLDYESDSQLSNSGSSIGLGSTNRHMSRRYGTLRRMPVSETSSRYSDSSDGSMRGGLEGGAQRELQNENNEIKSLLSGLLSQLLSQLLYQLLGEFLGVPRNRELQDDVNSDHDVTLTQENARTLEQTEQLDVTESLDETEPLRLVGIRNAEDMENDMVESESLKNANLENATLESTNWEILGSDLESRAAPSVPDADVPSNVLVKSLEKVTGSVPENVPESVPENFSEIAPANAPANALDGLEKSLDKALPRLPDSDDLVDKILENDLTPTLEKGPAQVLGRFMSIIQNDGLDPSQESSVGENDKSFDSLERLPRSQGISLDLHLAEGST